MAYPILCFFILFYFLSPSSSLEPFCNHHDHSALLQFKNSFSLDSFASGECVYFDQPSYPKTASWGNVSNCCLWDGVTCNSMSGHVIGLDLSCSWLQGHFHPNSTLFQLPHLQKLNLAFNDFNGSSISSKFGDLVSLTYLNLSSSVLVGEIPSQFSHLYKLASLDLSTNWVYSLDLRLGPSTWESLILNKTDLRELVLDGVNMSSIRLSSFPLLMNLSSSLISLSLGWTGLQGNSPNNFSSEISFLSNLHNLTSLNLRGNDFSGQIPSSFSNLEHLTTLDLSGNNFSGEISILSSLHNLTSLNLGFNGFSGQIPSSFSNLEHLTTLYLSWNNFSGEISILSSLHNLTSLGLRGNGFSGQIPSSFSNLTQLTNLDLGYNKLVDPIPEIIGKLSNLTSLDLSNNLFNGTIPSWIFSLPSLHSLYLGDNFLTGPIGQFSTNSLEECYLSNNKLQGKFPESIFGLTNLSTLELSSNNLSGLVKFHQFAKLQNLQALVLSNNKFLSLSFENNVNYTIPKLERLDLSSCKINDFPKLLANLQNLNYLNFSHNKIHGKVPKWFNDVGNGSLRYLDLSHNKLTSVEDLSVRNIEFLDLSFNMLLGNLPTPLFATRFLSVSNNKLSGDIPLSLCNASLLIILNLSHNNVTGVIPQCLAALPNLEILDLQMNHLIGTIPRNFSKSNVLHTLNFNSNQLQGSMPLSLAHCNRLKILDVGGNEIDDTFPNWLEGLQELQVLVLRDNKFHGAIYSSRTKHPFPKLGIFDVSNNHFSGSLPTTYIKEFKGMMTTKNGSAGLQYMKNKNYSLYDDSVIITLKGNIIELERIKTTFTTIDLSNNMFEGEIPKVIGDLNSLIGLNLSHNRITGSIPQSMGNLKSLEWLDLSSNMLMGEIPQTLTSLNFLSVLNLSQNQLEGAIPKGKQFDTFQNDSYKGNVGLCGVPLSKTCYKDEGEWPSSSSTTDHDGFGFGWRAVALGYGCGMIFGMLMGYIVFSFGKPEWLVRIVEGKPKRRIRNTRNKSHANQGIMN